MKIPFHRLAHFKTTPGLLKVKLWAIWLGCAGLFLITYLSAAQHRSALITTGRAAVPNIVNAQRIRAGLAELDAQAANELVGKPGENMKAVKDYDARLKEVIQELNYASEHVSFGDAERAQITVLADGLSSYQAWITQARSMQSHGDAAILAAYRHATRLMHATLLPAADSLDRINSDALERVYTHHNALSTGLVCLLGLAGLTVVAGMAYTQYFLSRRMRRLLNPPLLAASLCTATYLVYAISMLLSSAQSLKAAKTEYYPRLAAAWQARAIAFQAKAQTSTWLLDRPLADSYQRDFDASVKQVQSMPFGTQFEDYLAADTKVRSLETAGQHNKAVSIAIGKDAGEANYAFDLYDKAVVAEQVNDQREFDRCIARGLSSLSLFNWMAPAAALLTAILTLVGLRPRMHEYH